MALNLNKDGGQKKKFDLSKKPEVQSSIQEEALISNTSASRPKKSNKLLWIVIGGLVIAGGIWFIASKTSGETSPSVVENSQADSSAAMASSTVAATNTDSALQTAASNPSGNSTVENPTKAVASNNSPDVSAKASEQAPPPPPVKRNDATNSKPTADTKLSVVAKSTDKTNTNFSAGSSNVSYISQAFVNEIIAFVSKKPSAKITINGYASSDGNLNVNQELSQKRADKVRDYFVTKGIPTGQLEAVGKGIENPIGDNSTLEGRAKNRRTEVIYK